MNSHCQYRVRSMLLLAVSGVLLFSSNSANSLRIVGGKEPVGDGPWPDGCQAVANLPTRFIYSSGDFLGVSTGTEFVYRGDTEAFQKALDVFAAIRAPSLELCVRDGPHIDPMVKTREEKDDGGRIDWTFSLMNPEGWHALYNNPESSFVSNSDAYHKPVPPPCIDVYVTAPPTPGGIDWAKLKLPASIQVTDKRAAAQPPKPAAAPMLRGAIYNLANGKTISGARIEVRKWDDKTKWQSVAQTTVDATGAFQITQLPAGSAQVLASAKGFAPRIIGYPTFTPDAYLRLDGELSAEVTINGTVTDEQDKPLVGIRVRVENPLGIDGRGYIPPEQMETISDAAGQFTLIGAPTGFAQFACKGAGYELLNPRTLWKLASWKKIIANDVKETGRIPVFLRMAAPGKIYCKVVTTDGTPLKGEWDATIADAEGGYSRNSNKLHRTVHVQPDGTAEFANVPVGRYFAVIGYWIDMENDIKIVTVSAGQTAEINLAVKPRPARVKEPKPESPSKQATDDKF